MKMTAKAAQANGHGESLEQVKQHFALWRESRKRGERISNALWAKAVAMVQQHGLQQTAKELRIDYGQLKKRLEHGAGTQGISKPETGFMELLVPAAFGAVPMAACIVEMENARGAKMRVELKGTDALADLASAFWSAH